MTADRESPIFVERGAAQRGHGPDEALELKMPKEAPGVINVRIAGHACCSADLEVTGGR